MTSALEALNPPLRWALLAAITLFGAANLLMAAVQIGLIVAGSDAVDWYTYVAATDRYGAGTLYQPAEWWYGWRYSPIAVFPFMLLAPLGETAWRLLLLAALVGLPGRLRFLALASYPFWFAVHAGNAIVFVVVAAYWALRGNTWAIAIFLGFALLVPRPLMIPIVVWILWKHPPWRWRFAILFAVHGLLVVATGYMDDWVGRLLVVGWEEVSGSYNVAPSALVGLAWMVVAVPLAVWAFRVAQPALSGLFLQPYWLPYYLLIVLADRWPPWPWWRAHLLGRPVPDPHLSA